MLDLKFIRENEADLRDTIKRQKREELLSVLDNLLAKDKEWRELKGQIDSLRADRNKASEDINAAKKAGEDASDAIAKAKEIPGKIKDVESKFAALTSEINKERSKIPNVMHKDVPYGKDEADNPEIRKGGKPKKFSFKVKNHVELCEDLGIADFEESAVTSGAGFYFLKGDLGRLNQALIKYAVDLLEKRGYTYIEPPLMVKQGVIAAASDLESIKQSVYMTNHSESEEEMCLIGTAEHAILGMHWNHILTEDDLPKKYAGYSMCFRAEIGSHGINEKGLWRTHQFNKVEQFVFCLPEQSWKIYEELLSNSEEILKGLELPYRVVEICTGDLANWKARSHDVEVWRPTTESYGEVMSCSNCTVYQATDLNIRYKKRSGESGVVHTLNNTALATSRIMVAVLENYQNEDGSIDIPKALQSIMGKKKIEPLGKRKVY
ncbi:serine--tRNA ligase [Candidatus Woesearchaeota archaeon]|nr:serine--tRNA ligase [Candidatus Woesearchaeota archaeon]